MNIEDKITISGTMADIIRLLDRAIQAGYGDAPAALCIKLYLTRN